MKMLRKKIKQFNNVYSLNTSQSAKFLGVSESLLRKLRQNEKGPRYSKVGSRIVYPINELVKYINSNIV